jgi:hypothetical protein
VFCEILVDHGHKPVYRINVRRECFHFDFSNWSIEVKIQASRIGASVSSSGKLADMAQNGHCQNEYKPPARRFRSEIPSIEV